MTIIGSKAPFRESFYMPAAIKKTLTPAAGGAVSLVRGSSAMYTNAAGLKVSAGNNESRPDHVLIGGQLISAGLLIEPASTNLHTQSGDLSNGAWTKNNLTATAAMSPDGTENAWLITESTDGSPNFHRMYQTVLVTSGVRYTASMYVKPGSRKVLSTNIQGALVGIVYFYMESLTAVIAGSQPGVTAKITPEPAGWYRVSVSMTATASASLNIQWWLGTDAYYQGDGSSMTWWNPQLEASLVPTSPIITSASTVTRAADQLVLSGASFANAYGTTGMLVASIRTQTAVRGVDIVSINDGTADNRLELRIDSNGDYAGIVKAGGVTTFSDAITKTTYDNELITAGISFAATKTLIAVKAEQGEIDNAVGMPTDPIQLEIGGGGFIGHISSLKLFKEQYSDQKFVNLTGQQSTIAPDVLAVDHVSRIIVDGNSLSTVNYGNYPGLLMAGLASKIPTAELTNISVGGQNTVTMNSDRLAQVHPLIVSGQTIIIPWEISNHIYTLGATSRQAVDEMWTYCDAVRELGAKVVVATPTPRSNAGTPVDFETKRQAACTFMRNEWRSHGDAFVDIALDARIGVAGAEEDETYYSGDLVHLNATGAAVVAELMSVGVLTAANADSYTDYADIRLSSTKAEMFRPFNFANYNLAAPSARIRFNCSYPEIVMEFKTNSPEGASVNGALMVLVNGTLYSQTNLTASSGASFHVSVVGVGTRLIEVILPYAMHVDFIGVRRFGSGRLSKPTARPTKKLVVVGDSITQGFSATSSIKTWTYLLGQLQTAQVVNFGFGSITAADLVSAAPVIGQQDADAFIYCIGYNNFAAQHALSSFKGWVKQFLDGLRALHPTTKVYLGGPFYTTNTNTLTPANYRTQISDLVTEEDDPNTIYVDTLAATANNSNRLVDGIHFTDLGTEEASIYFNTLLGA